MPRRLQPIQLWTKKKNEGIKAASGGLYGISKPLSLQLEIRYLHILIPTSKIELHYL